MARFPANVKRVDAVVIDAVGNRPQQGPVSVIVERHRKPGLKRLIPETTHPWVQGFCAEADCDRKLVLVAGHKIVTHVESRNRPAEPRVDRIHRFRQAGGLSRICCKCIRPEFQRPALVAEID